MTARSWAFGTSLRRWLAAVVTAFALSRLGYALAGVRFDASALHPAGPLQDQWQLIDTQLLSRELFRSVWYLHSQPPLYNLFCGLLLHLPRGLQVPVAWTCFFALGLAMVCCTFLLLAELGVPTWGALAVTTIVIADPAAVLYENWLSWSYPAAALTTIGVYFCVRYVRTRRTWCGVAFFSCIAAVVLDDSTYQWPWLLAAAILVLIVTRSFWRTTLRVMAVPLSLVAFWSVKDAVQFGTATTSSWLGMNLASTTVESPPHAPVERLVREGRLSPLAEIPALAPLDRYVPRFASLERTGVPALDQTVKSDGTPNRNNLAYVGISRRYLAADLAFVREDPARYVRMVRLAAEVWFVPAEEYPFVSANFAHIRSYARAFEVASLQIHAPRLPSIGFDAAGGRAPAPGELSYLTLLVYVVALLLAPIVLFRRRSPGIRCAGLLMWLTILYALVTTSLVSIGENMRFRFELGSIPIALAAASIAALLARKQQRHRAGELGPASAESRAGATRSAVELKVTGSERNSTISV